MVIKDKYEVLEQCEHCVIDIERPHRSRCEHYGTSLDNMADAIGYISLGNSNSVIIPHRWECHKWEQGKHCYVIKELDDESR